MIRDPDVSGTAALSICESLLLCLSDRSILNEREVIGILEDAANAHSAAAEETANREMHLATEALIRAIIDSGNSVRRREQS
jgi:ABC-type antimicrobial peptide transport system ATPase subunit